VVDPACPQMKEVYQASHKLVKINLHTNAVEQTFFFEGIASEKSYINDVRVDTSKGIAYLTNSNEGGILIVDFVSGKIRQVLQGHPSVKSDPSFTFVIDGHEMMKEGKPAKMQSDGIALTPDGEWLYYKPLTDNKLYRIQTKHLRDESLSAEELGNHVQDLGRFTTTDGMIFDKEGTYTLVTCRILALINLTKTTTCEPCCRMINSCGRIAIRYLKTVISISLVRKYTSNQSIMKEKTNEPHLIPSTG
jgi:sugar lactone lactonase YvrE